MTVRKKQNVVLAGHKGFTLVELLVVIGIIGLLVSILLPALTKARQQANTVACAANLRSILQGMQLYASQNNGWIPGSPQSSGAFLTEPPTASAVEWNNFFGDATGNPGGLPLVCHTFDWQAPIAAAEGISFNQGSDAASLEQRFMFLNTYPGFTCPANHFLSNPYSTTSNYGVIAMPSYATSINFLLENQPSSKTGAPIDTDFRQFEDAALYVLPGGYIPKLAKVAHASNKIYISDGSKYSDPTPASPTYDSAGAYESQSIGGNYSDFGSYAEYSESLNCTAAAGNTEIVTGGTLDPRIFGFRHGNQSPFGKNGSYLFNAGFFDGHVETLSDVQGENPSYWMPDGTLMSNVEFTANAAKLYSSNGTRTSGTTVVP